MSLVQVFNGIDPFALVLGGITIGFIWGLIVGILAAAATGVVVLETSDNR